MSSRRNHKAESARLSPFIGKRVTHQALMWRTDIQSGMRIVTHYLDHRDVTLMAISDSYVMVRRPGARPYVADAKDIITK